MPKSQLHPALAQALDARGYDTLTPVQAAVVAPEAEGRDLIVSAKTGSGKTVAFGLAFAGQLTAAGLSGTIFFYVSINLMMVMGLAPVVGVPLPLVSFGGSAVMTVMLCLGLLMALERHQRTGSAASTSY